MFESGERVCDPEAVRPDQWEYILTLPTKTARTKEYGFIGRKQYLEQKDKVGVVSNASSQLVNVYDEFVFLFSFL